MINDVAIPVDFATDNLDWIKELVSICTEKGGVGIAAPQIGISKRVIYIKTLDLVMINPTILWRSENTMTREEGCLSFPGVEVSVDRSVSISINWFDRHFKLNAKQISRAFSGLEAKIIQHEIDHLNGITIMNRSPDAKHE